MKKYLSLAIVLGAIAFASVSFLAQAEPEATAVEHAMDAAAPAADQAAKDAADCTAMAATPTTEGAQPTDAEKDAAFKKCITDKGHGGEAHTQEAPATEAAPAAEGEKAAE